MHQPAWDRLAHLAARSRRRRSQLTPVELEELVHLYQQVSAQLSTARVAYPDDALHGRLTRVVADGHAAVHGARERSRGAVVRFVTRTFPEEVWRIRWFVLVAAALTFVPALVVGAWLGVSDAAVEASGPAAVREAYITQDFEAYYSSEPAAQFATKVTVNNIRVSITAYALGIVACVGTAGILIFNGANVGQAGGLFVSVGEADRFFGLILPHGLLELTAVVVAGAAGLRLGWTLIDPGDRPRAAALAAEGRRSFNVVLGLVGAFVVAGLIEGFVTGSALPTGVRVGIGVLVEVAFISYIVRFGRRPVSATPAPI